MSELAHVEERPLASAAGGRTLRGLVLYFLRLGSWGFGGPIALAGYMRRDLVEEGRWYSEEEYQQGLAIAQTMPGPLAAQLAMWLGYLERGARGALAVTVPFVVPPFLIVTVVAIFYARYQGLPWVEDVFFGVGPAVMAIIAIAAYKLGRATNKREPMLWAIAIVLCLATAISGAEIVWLFLLAGAFGAVYYGGGLPRLRGRLASFVPLPLLASVNGFAWTGSGAELGTMALFFIEAGAFTFGSGLAIVPFLVVPGGWFRRHEKHPRLQGFVKGATAAAVGAIAGAAIVIGRQTITGPLTAAIALVALAVLLQKRVKVSEPVIVAAAAVAGLLLHN